MASIDQFKYAIDRLKNNPDDFESVLPERQKKFASYEEQIQNLQSKGARIGKNSEECQRKLCEVTYYRMRGYLQRPHHKDYIPFKNACRFDEFDTKMRDLLFSALSRIEVSLRCQFSYFYAGCKGPYGHLNRSNHTSDESYDRFLDIVWNRVQETASTPFVKHYLKEYNGLMPLWVLSELLTFGHWVEFYQDWTLEDKKSLIDQFYGKDTKFYRKGSKKPQMAKGIKKKIRARKLLVTGSDANITQEERGKAENNPRFLSWLLSCRNLRNICAHCGRLSYRAFQWNTNLPDEYSQQLNNENRKSGEKLWEKILAVQFLYPDPHEWTSVIVPQIKDLLKIAYSQGNSLNDDLLLSALGFPPDWEEQLKKWETL